MFRGPADIQKATSFDLRDGTNLILTFAHLHQKLRRRYRSVDDHWIDDAVADALLYNLCCPEGFDASQRVPLIKYLEMQVRRNLYVRIRTRRRRCRHETPIGVAEKNFQKILSEKGVERCINIGKDKKGDQINEWRERLNAVTSQMNARDRAAVELLRDGGSLKEWVRHLAIEHLALEEQRSKVYKEKDRLKQKLKRMARKVQGGGSFPFGALVRATGYETSGERESWRRQPKKPHIQVLASKQ